MEVSDQPRETPLHSVRERKRRAVWVVGQHYLHCIRQRDDMAERIIPARTLHSFCLTDVKNRAALFRVQR
jgi:hypothetical protein